MPLNDDSLADLELLDYWYRHPLLPGSPELDRELKHGYAHLGFSHLYLLNGILALTSLRRFGEDRSRTSWYTRALAHQQAAISRIQPHFQSTDTSHRKAILAFSTLTSLYAVAEPTYRPTSFNNNHSDFDPVEEFLRAIRLGRHTTAFVQQHLSSVATADPFTALKYSPNSLEITCNLEEHFSQLPLLRESILRWCEGEQQAACLDAVERLFMCIKVLTDNPGNNHHMMVIFKWAKEVNSIFLDMCSARHPMALIILAHFAALMSLSQGFWLLHHWPSILLTYIREHLKDWGDLLQWPTGIISHNNGASRLAINPHDSKQLL